MIEIFWKKKSLLNGQKLTKKKTSIKAVKDQAAPMIKWLKEAEEEESEEEAE